MLEFEGEVGGAGEEKGAIGYDDRAADGARTAQKERMRREKEAKVGTCTCKQCWMSD